MSTASRPPAPTTSPSRRLYVDNLQSGDRLTRAEFHRRYLKTPKGFKAELVEGVVYVASPASADNHGLPTFNVLGWLSPYVAATPGVDGFDNTTVMLDVDNEVQPDACLRVLESQGGQSQVADNYVQGAPELVVEVAASSASYDLHDKLNAYRRNGVIEYVVWRVLDAAIDWFVLREGEYLNHSPDDDGLFRSQIFPGLWLDGQALLAGDLARVIDVVAQGTKSPEHEQFRQRLGASCEQQASE